MSVESKLRDCVVFRVLQKLIPQCSDLAGPADQVGEFNYVSIIPQEGGEPVGVIDELLAGGPGSPGVVAEDISVLGHHHG